MGSTIQETGTALKRMVMGSTSGRMETNTWENGINASSKDSVMITLGMGTNMRGLILRENFTAEAGSYGKMECHMKECSRMGCDTVRECGERKN